MINVLSVPNPTVTNTYIRPTQNVIHKEHPNGFPKPTLLIFPLVNKDAIPLAISLGNYKMSHTIVIINAIVNNVKTIY